MIRVVESHLPARLVATEAVRPVAWLLLAFLMLQHALPYAWATILLDTSRDLDQAYRIAFDAALPWLGPRVADAWHLGPWWFYLLALTLVLSGSLALTLIFVGVLAALKFPLAFLCGRRAVGTRFGVLWACALALPGWNRMQPLVPTHTNLLEAGMLATIYALIRLWQGGSSRWWWGYGLLHGLALHAHPTAAILFLGLPLLLWRRRQRFRDDLPWMLLGATLAGCLFLPPFLQVWIGPDTTDSVQAAWSDARTPLDSVRAIPGLLYGIVVGGFALTATDLVPPSLGVALWCLFAFVLVAAIAGLLLGRKARAVRWLSVAAIGALIVIAALRSRTPFYMSYAWLPLFSAVVGAGWWWLDQRWRPLGSIAACAALVSCAAMTIAAVYSAEQGLGVFRPTSVFDVRAESAPRPGPQLPVWRFDRWGRDACRRGDDLILHGDLASLVDAGLGLSMRIACGDAVRIGIGGGARAGEGTHHLLGLMPGQWQALGLDRSSWEQTFERQPTRIVAGDRSEEVASGGLLELRARSQGVAREHEFRFETPASAWVSVANLFALYDGSRVLAVEAAGRPREPVHATSTTAIYRCDDCPPSSSVSWNVRYSTALPDRVDVVWFEP